MRRDLPEFSVICLSLTIKNIPKQYPVMFGQQPPKSFSVSTLSLFYSVLYTVAQLMFLKHILNSLTSLFSKHKLLSMVYKWSPDSSVGFSKCTTIWFPYMFPKDFLLLTFIHPTQWPSQTHCFLTGAVLCCPWAIAYAVPPTPILPTHLWILRSFEVQVRFCFSMKPFWFLSWK